MIGFTKTYTDFNGVEKTETFHFNLTKTELAKLALGPAGGLEAMLQEIINTSDTARIMELVETIILDAYGKKTPDGRFIKKDKDGHRLSDDFAQSAAFDEFFMELMFNPDKLVDFINGCVPAELSSDAGMQRASEQAKARIAAINS